MIDIINVQRSASFSWHSITERVQTLIDTSQQPKGRVCASSQHTTTALIINEMQEGLILDLEKWLSKIALPLEGCKHAELHLQLAQYQDIILVELDGAKNINIIISF